MKRGRGEARDDSGLVRPRGARETGQGARGARANGPRTAATGCAVIFQARGCWQDGQRSCVWQMLPPPSRPTRFPPSEYQVRAAWLATDDSLAQRAAASMSRTSDKLKCTPTSGIFRKRDKWGSKAPLRPSLCPHGASPSDCHAVLLTASCHPTSVACSTGRRARYEHDSRASCAITFAQPALDCLSEARPLLAASSKKESSWQPLAGCFPYHPPIPKTAWGCCPCAYQSYHQTHYVPQRNAPSQTEHELPGR